MRKPQKYLERGIIYQINLRSFTNEGTLNAAAKLLPHIRKFADIVYLCPCFVQDDDENREFWSDRTKASKLENPLNPYRISDYYNVDPEYGTGEDLKNFVAAAHEVGLRVILDLVYFHCGPNAVFINNHPDFIVRDADGKPDMGQWHYPKLNFGS
ncbi:MAG: alpha-amylase family glycosyl hydrolase, partial [Candidatus Flemingiibacterium sp.]